MSMETSGDAAYWQARAEALERERLRLLDNGKMWHSRTLEVMAVLKVVLGLLQEAPDLFQRYQDMRRDMSITYDVQTLETILALLLAERGQPFEVPLEKLVNPRQLILFTLQPPEKVALIVWVAPERR